MFVFTSSTEKGKQIRYSVNCMIFLYGFCSFSEKKNHKKIFSLNIYALNIYMYINVEFQKGENYRKRFKKMQNIHLARLIESF